MRHHVHDLRHGFEHRIACGQRDVVAGAHIERTVDFDVDVDQDHVAHAPGAHVVQAEHLRRGADDLLDARVVGLVGRAVHQIVQRIPGELPAHAQHEQADDERGDGIENRITEQAATDARERHQRRRGIGPRMPGVGHQQGRAHALRDREHVAKQQFLRDERGARGPQGDGLRGGDRLWPQNLVHPGPEHGGRDRDEQQADHERGRVLVTVMPVMMVLVRGLAAEPVGDQHDEIGKQIRQGMHAVGDQGLRLRERADEDLQIRQAEVHRDADPGAAARGLGARFGADGFDIIEQVGGLHGVGLKMRRTATQAAREYAGRCLKAR